VSSSDQSEVGEGRRAAAPIVGVSGEKKMVHMALWVSVPKTAEESTGGNDQIVQIST